MCGDAGESQMVADIPNGGDRHIGSGGTDTGNPCFTGGFQDPLPIPCVQVADLICQSETGIIPRNAHNDRAESHFSCFPDQRHLIDAGAQYHQFFH